MRFDDLDKTMRSYETRYDACADADAFLIARLDGRGFTRLTKELEPFEKPFDVRFRDVMEATTRHLMTCGLEIVYGYAQSDEISLLFHPDEQSFGRKTRKLNSVLAGEASSAFSLALGRHAAFDCRLVELPDRQRVVDYYRWRAEDARWNSLSAYGYWHFRGIGDSPKAADRRLVGLSPSDKATLLRKEGVDVDGMPKWQSRGYAVVWERYLKEGHNPVTGETTMTERRRLTVDFELPAGSTLDAYLLRFLDAGGASGSRD
ncbi:MAG: tRNA(His) guanylyltransferase Thg1 family protein [Acidobacteriota bacterium]